MVTEVRSLLVTTDMDVSGYTSAARQKTAADTAMAESSRVVGAAQQQMEQKITATGSSVDRLKARFIEGERAARDMAKTVDQVSRGFASGRISAQEAEQVLQGVVRTYGRTIDASAAVARGQAELAAAAANVNTAFRQQQVAAETEKLERSAASLRAEIDPLGASQLQLNSKLAEYRTLLASGVISTNEFAKAQSAAQAKHDAFAKSLSGNHGVNTMAATMAAYQFQDIATQAVGGASIGTIALQQGPQLAMSLGQGGATGALKTLGAGLLSLVGPANLVAIGLTAAGAAAIQYFTAGKKGADDLETALKNHSATLSMLKEQYGDLAKSAGQTGVGRQFTDASARSDVAALQAALRAQSGELSGSLLGGGFLRGGLFGSNTSALDDLLATKNSAFQADVERLLEAARNGQDGLSKFDDALTHTFDQLRNGTAAPGKLYEELQRLSALAQDAFSTKSEYAPFQAEIDRLVIGLKEGKDYASEFAGNVHRIGEVNGIQKVADELILATKNAIDLSRSLKEVETVLQTMFNDRGPNGLLLSQGTTSRADQNAAGIFASRQAMDLKRMQESYQAQIAEMNARSPAEKAAAARASAAAQYNDQESPEIRRTRIELAGKQAQLAAEKQLADAQRDRQISLDAEVESAQQQLSLIGRTGGELVALQKRYELIAQLKQEAARNGTQVDEKEIELIKQKTAELGRLADQQSRARLSYDLGQQWKSLGRTDQENQVASTLQQYNLPDNLSSPEATQIRNLLNAQQMKSDLTTFFTDFRTELVNNGGDLGKALMTSLENAALNQLNRIWDRMFEQLANNIVKSVFGGADAGGVTGAGGIVGAIGKAITGGAANDNNSLAPVIPVTRAPLGGIPSTDVATYITQAATARGIDPYYALKVAKSEGGLDSWNLQSSVFKNGVQEPSFGPYQLYMNGGLGNAFQRATGLDPRLASNGPAGVDFALDYAKKNGWGAWYGAAKVGVGKWDGIGSASASGDVDKFTGSIKSATGSVGQLGNGMNNVSNGMTQLGNGMNAAGQKLASASSGGGDILGSLLGGLSGYGKSVFSSSTQFASAWKLGGVGLYGDGGYTGSLGEREVAGVVHGGEYVFSKRATDRLGIGTLDALHRRAKGYADGGYVGAAANANVPGAGNGRVQVNIINNNGSQVSQQARQTPDGLQLDVMIDEAVAKKIATPGSGTRRAMTSQFGLGGSLARR
jgi:hypothetical protein